MSERVQKHLARMGFGSRREIEKWLREGKISNEQGKLKPGDRVSVNDVLIVNGTKVEVSDTEIMTRLLAYHKKEGQICTHNDPQNRSLVLDSLPEINNGRWLSAGRLDINTTGLMLFSNDGHLVHALMHPSHEIEREYLCRVLGSVPDKVLKKLQQGVRSDREIMKFKEVGFVDGKGSNRWYRIVLTGGKNREIRRAWQAVGYEVNRLKRIRYGHYRLPRHLKPGNWIELGDQDVQKFRNLCG